MHNSLNGNTYLPQARLFTLGLLLFSLPLGQAFFTNLLILILTILSFVGSSKVHLIATLKSPLFLFPALFFGLHFTSLLWSENITGGLEQLETKVSFVLVVFVMLLLTATLHERGLRKKLMKTFILGNVFTLLLAFVIAGSKALALGSLTRLSPGGTYQQHLFTYEVLAEPFMHPGYLATHFGLAILLSIYLTITVVGRKRYVWLGAVFLLFFGMLMLQGRINIIALLIILLGGGIWVAIKKRAFIWLGVPIICVLALALFMVFGSTQVKERYLQMPDFNFDMRGSDFNSATFRLAEWTCALTAIQEAPVFGAGVGDNRKVLLEAYQSNGFAEGIKQKFNSHNQYLETTVALGLMGLLALLSVLYVYFRKALKQKDYVLLACLLFFALSMLTESMLERAWAVVLFCVFFPFFAGVSKPSNTKSP